MALQSTSSSALPRRYTSVRLVLHCAFRRPSLVTCDFANFGLHTRPAPLHCIGPGSSACVHDYLVCRRPPCLAARLSADSACPPPPSAQNGWKLLLWTAADILDLVAREFPEFLPKFEGFDATIKRIDAARYLILLAHGGVCALL